MGDFTTVTTDTVAVDSDINQYADAFNGTSGAGKQMLLTQLAKDDFYITLRNLHANSKAVQILKADGTVLFQIDANGVRLSPGGDAATVPLSTGGSQILTNKRVGDRLDFSQVAVPSAPDAGVTRLFALSTDGTPWIVLPNGVVRPAGSIAKIAEAALSVSAASVTFSSIPALYRDLLVVFAARSDVAATVNDIKLRLNADAGTNYAYQIAALTTALSGASQVTQDGIVIGRCPGNTAPANHFGGGDILIPNYGLLLTDQHVVLGRGYYRVGAVVGNPTSYLSGGDWGNAAAITSLTLFPVGANFVAGCVIGLYGIV